MSRLSGKSTLAGASFALGRPRLTPCDGSQSSFKIFIPQLYQRGFAIYCRNDARISAIVEDFTVPLRKKYDAFLSYSRNDEPMVGPIVQTLQAAGWSVFVDRQDMVPGDDWQENLAGVSDAPD